MSLKVSKNKFRYYPLGVRVRRKSSLTELPEKKKSEPVPLFGGFGLNTKLNKSTNVGECGVDDDERDL